MAYTFRTSCVVHLKAGVIMRRMCAENCGRRASAESPEGRLCEPCLHYAEAENEHCDYRHNMYLEHVLRWDAILSDDESQLSSAVVDSILIDEDPSVLIQMNHCAVCRPELDPRGNVKQGHTNTQAQSWSSHAECTHPATPRHRAACRKTRRINADS